MSDLVVQGGAVLAPTGRVAADVVIRAGRIAEVARRDAAGGGPAADARDTAASGVLDATGLVVAPGFVDLQCNGAGGIDLAATPERLWELAALLPRWGVTAWLPTVVTSPAAVRARALAALRAGPPPSEPAEAAPGATPLGLHFEGPFLAPERRGAHPAAHLRPPDLAAVDGWARDAGVALVTLAPELPGALDLVHALVARGVAVWLGHSSATAEQATAAVDAGARGVTHLFNAMGPFHHRAPGLAGVALTDDRLAVGVIADGHHLDPRALRLAVRALGPRLVAVSDAVAGAGDVAGPRGGATGDVLGDVTGDHGALRLADGTLAGGAVPLHRAVANLMATGGASLEEAVAAATRAPARALGQEGERGLVAPGAAGDLVLLDTGPDAGPDGAPDGGPGARIEVVATVIGGEIAWSTDPARHVPPAPRSDHFP